MSPPPNFHNPRKWVRSEPTNNAIKTNTKIVKNQIAKPKKGPVASPSTLRKTFKPDNRIYCRYFNATGICRNHKYCKFEHDFSRVKICPEFIRRGECEAPNCKLRHVIDPHTMEHCVHFTKSTCSKGKKCPFPHVKVAENARVCINFQQGYCAKGLECRLRHERKKKKDKEDQKVINPLEALLPFKSEAEKEQEQLEKEILDTEIQTGWRSLFAVPNQPLQTLPDISKMRDSLENLTQTEQDDYLPPKIKEEEKITRRYLSTTKVVKNCSWDIPGLCMKLL